MSTQASDLNTDTKTPVTPIESKELTVDETFNFLSEEGEPEPKADKKDKPAKEKAPKTDEDTESDEIDVKSDEEDKEEKEDEFIDELAELEAELEDEPGKEKLELVTPVSRREILKQYPELFKKFPYLEKAYYREQQFTKYFPNPDDARDASEKAEALANFEIDIVDKGNVHNVLKLIKNNNPNKFAEVCDNYMDHLQEVDQSAYNHVLGNITKQIIASMYQEGKDADNDELKQAAVILNQYAFGSSKYKPPTKLARATPERSEQQRQTSVREQELIQTSYNNANEDVSAKVNNFFKINIDANIDPKKSMSDFVRKNASREAIEKIQDLISRDTRFKTLTDRLWENAAKDNFSKTSVDKIKKAFIARGRSLLTPVVKSVRNEAMRGMGYKIKETDEEETDTGKEKKLPERREQRLSSERPKAKDIPKGMSTLDALNSMMRD